MAILRAFGSVNPLDGVPVPPDTVTTILLTGGSSAQAVDFPSGAAGGIMRVTSFTEVGGAFLAFLCIGSTRAAVATAGTTNSTAASSGVSALPIPSQTRFQVPGGSTGFSVAAITSGFVQVEYWKK